MSYQMPTPTRDRVQLGDLASVRDAAQLLGCTERYVCKLCSKRLLKAVKVGRVWRIATKSLLEYAGLEG